jgi:hypothetical protein
MKGLFEDHGSRFTSNFKSENVALNLFFCEINTMKSDLQHLTIICPVYSEERTVPLFVDKPIIDELLLAVQSRFTVPEQCITDGTYDDWTSAASTNLYI